MSGSWRGYSRYAGCGVPISATSASTGGSMVHSAATCRLGRKLSCPTATCRVWERLPYTLAIHRGGANGENPHAHPMFSERGHDGIERSAEQCFKHYNAKAPEKGGGAEVAGGQGRGLTGEDPQGAGTDAVGRHGVVRRNGDGRRRRSPSKRRSCGFGLFGLSGRCAPQARPKTFGRDGRTSTPPWGEYSVVPGQFGCLPIPGRMRPPK